MKTKTVVDNVEKQLLGKFADPERELWVDRLSRGEWERLLVGQAERAAARLRSQRTPRRPSTAAKSSERTYTPLAPKRA